jgi:hypothetical protein
LSQDDKDLSLPDTEMPIRASSLQGFGAQKDLPIADLVMEIVTDHLAVRRWFNTSPSQLRSRGADAADSMR